MNLVNSLQLSVQGSTHTYRLFATGQGEYASDQLRCQIPQEAADAISAILSNHPSVGAYWRASQHFSVPTPDGRYDVEVDAEMRRLYVRQQRIPAAAHTPLIPPPPVG